MIYYEPALYYSPLYIFHSNRNLIASNIFNSCSSIGLLLENSNYNIIKNNIFQKCYSGIGLLGSNLNKILNNTIYNCSHWSGIFIDESSNNTVKGNVMLNGNGGLIIWGYTLEHFIHNIDENVINGKPIYYWKDVKNRKIPLNAGQIILVNCSNVSIEDLKLMYSNIQITFSSNISIKNNIITIVWNKLNSQYYNLYYNPYFGIRIYRSANCSIVNNSILGNYYGIILLNSNDNVITRNDLLTNIISLELEYSNNNIIYLNNINKCSCFNSRNIWYSLEKIKYRYINKTLVGFLGNYWENYSGPDYNKDGVCDLSYVIDKYNGDPYPLLRPWAQYFLPVEHTIDNTTLYVIIQKHEYEGLEWLKIFIDDQEINTYNNISTGELTIVESYSLSPGIHRVKIRYAYYTGQGCEIYQDIYISNSGINEIIFNIGSAGASCLCIPEIYEGKEQYYPSCMFSDNLTPLHVTIYKMPDLRIKWIKVLVDGTVVDTFYSDSWIITNNGNYIIGVIYNVSVDLHDIEIRYMAEFLQGGAYIHAYAEPAGTCTIDFELPVLTVKKTHKILSEFIYTPQCPTIGQTITFDASLSYSPNKIVSYEWDFGDGTTAEGKIVYHKYDEEGKYIVKLTIKDERGLTATKEKVITVLNSSKPVIIRVQPKIGGIVIKGISFENTYTAYVKSKTPIDRVIFKLNGKVVYVDTNGSDGWSARINTNLFDNDSILEVIAVDKNGIKSDPYTLKIRVIGIPEWLNWFIKYGNVSVSSDGTITFEKFIPDPPIDASVRIPKSIPVIGGEQNFKAQSRFAIIYEMPTQTAVVAGVGIIKIKILDRETEGRIGTEGTIEVPSFKLKGARVWGYIEIEVFSQTWNIADIPIVGEIKFDVGVSPHVKVEANITAEESVKLKDGSIYPGMKAEGEAKFDFKVAKVEIGGEGDATSKIHIPAPYDPSVTAEVSAYGVVKAGIFEADISVGPYKYRYPESSAKVLKIPKEYVRVSEWRLVKKYGGIPAYKVGIKSLVNVMTVQPLAQTEYGRVTINNVEDENPSVIYINNSSYLMVWSAQDPEKDVKSGHDLYYVIYTPSVGWSEIKKLTNDYFDDRNPVLAKLGSKVVCVWTVVNKDLRKENVTSPYDVFPYVEIAYSVYNGTWSKPVIITNNSEFEYNLNIYCNNNETCIIAWEVDKDLNFSTSDKVVKLALLNTTTSEFRIIREISDATKPTLAGNYIAYFDPVDNKLVFRSIKPFKVITSYNCLDLMDVDLSCYNDNCTLVWIDNFDIFYANPPNNAVKLDCNCSAYTIDVEDFETYKLLVFSGKAPGDVKQRIFYMVGYNNSWVEKRTLAGGTNLTFWQVNYAYDSSGFFAVFAGKEKLDDKNDIFYVYHKYAGDLEIYANISGSYTINDNVIVNYTVRNVGDQPVSDFTVEIYNLNMEKLASKDFDGLDVGAIVNDSFNVKLDESGGFVIKVLATPDLDMSNNIVKLVLLHPDLTVKELKESRINDKLIINVSFENLGSVDANNVTFKLLNGNRTLYSGVIDLQAGCSTNYTITINITDIDRNLTSCIVIDSEDKILEEREDNNILYFRTLMTDLSIGTVKAIDNGSGVRLKVLVGNYGLGDSTANLTVLDENLTPIKYITFTINGSNIPIFKEITLVLSYDEWNKAKYVCVEDRYDKNFGNNIAEVEKSLLKMPIAEFTHEPSTLRLFAGKLILFKSTSYDLDGNITLYIWNFGDGNVIVTNSSMIEHKYDNIGNYTVTLTVVDDDGLTNSTSKKIVVVRAGDFNGDGEVDIGDVVYVAYIVIGKLPQDLRADFNDNGRVDIGDLAKIAYYLIGKINKL